MLLDFMGLLACALLLFGWPVPRQSSATFANFRRERLAIDRVVALEPVCTEGLATERRRAESNARQGSGECNNAAQTPLHSTAACSRVLRLLLPLLMSGDDLGAPLLRRRRLEVVARRVRGHVGLLHREELRHTRRRAVQPREVLRAHRLEGQANRTVSKRRRTERAA